MRKHEFHEHFKSVKGALIHGSYGAEDVSHCRMIAYERWLNDRPLMLSEQNECGKECVHYPYERYGDVPYEGWDYVEGCELHRELHNKNREEARAAHEKRQEAERKRKEEQAKQESKPKRFWSLW